MNLSAFDRQFLGQLDSVEQAIDATDFSKSAVVIFLTAFHAKLIALGVTEDVADTMAENMTIDIRTNEDDPDTRERGQVVLTSNQHHVNCPGCREAMETP